MEEKPAQLPVSEQETQIQTPSFLDKLKIHKFKILGGFLGILVFAGAVFGAYKFGQRQIQPAPQPIPTPEAVATPTPLPSEAPAKEGDLTANWKTYTNEKYGYSIKYPPPDLYMTFAPKSYETTDKSVLSYFGFGEDPDSSESLIAVAVVDRSFDEEIKLTRQILSIEKESETTIGGVKGTKFYGKKKGGIRHVFWIVLPKKNYTYVISTPEYSILDGFATFNFMLSTFRFLE